MEFPFQIVYEQLWRLFDIIPGLVHCEITGECKLERKGSCVAFNLTICDDCVSGDDNRNFACAEYATHDAALYAR